jgi:hypothetical protein
VGAWLTIDQAWALSVSWYHDRLDEGFHTRTYDEAIAIFSQLGLTGAFWSLDPPTPTP